MEKRETVEEQVHRLVTPIFDEILKNNKSSMRNEKNTMGVCKGSVQEKNKPITFFWRPNNYRIQIPFNREKLNLGIEEKEWTLLTKKRTSSVINSEYGKIKISNFGSKINCNIDGIFIMLDKKSITTTYSLRTAVSENQMKKAVYKIEANNINEIWERMQERIEEIKKVSLDAVKKFIKHYGGKADLDSFKFFRHEDAIHKEDWIPDETIIYDTHFKKVYPTEIELKNPLYVKNFYSNRVVEEIAPQIAKEIKESNNSIVNIKKTITEHLNPVLIDFTRQMELHLKVQKETEKTMRELRKPFFIRWYNYFRGNED